jgi:hypothetical protein
MCLPPPAARRSPPERPPPAGRGRPLHVPVQPEHPRHGTEPVPGGIFYGPLSDGTGEQRCAWSVRFVTNLGTGVRTRPWGWASGHTLATAPAGRSRHPARSCRPPPGGSSPASTPPEEDMP